MLGNVLSHISALEQHGSTLLNNSGRFVPQGALNEGVKNAASALMQSASELKLLLPLLAQSIPNDDDGDDDEDVIDNVRQRLGETAVNSTWGAISAAMGAILPMLDPEPHKSIFGLDVLRGTVLSRYKGASQMWFTRPTGGKIDAMHIPAQGWVLGANPKAVLYCNPNACLIEAAAGISLASGSCARSGDETDVSCWTDYYTQLGYDVYLFNYCGYGRSHASASDYNKVRTAGFLGVSCRILYSSFFAFSVSSENDAHSSALDHDHI